MGQFHFHPDEYLDLMKSELPDYDRLQDETAAACGSGGSRLLELGTGTGEPALRVLERHPGAALTGLDASADMLAVARSRLPDADLRVARLEDGLPLGDVVVPDDPADAVTPLTPGFDRPDRVEDQLGWLREAGFSASVAWARRDLAVIAANFGH